MTSKRRLVYNKRAQNREFSRVVTVPESTYVMRYRVAFTKRYTPDGESSDIDPTAFLDLADGIVQDKVFVERVEPDAKHSQEVLDEDDDFLGMASTEVWEYEVSDTRQDEFVTALTNSGTVMEYEAMDDQNTPSA
jgi:hypothetical protein